MFAGERTKPVDSADLSLLCKSRLEAWARQGLKKLVSVAVLVLRSWTQHLPLVARITSCFAKGLGWFAVNNLWSLAGVSKPVTANMVIDS